MPKWYCLVTADAVAGANRWRRSRLVKRSRYQRVTLTAAITAHSRNQKEGHKGQIPRRPARRRVCSGWLAAAGGAGLTPAAANWTRPIEQPSIWPRPSPLLGPVAPINPVAPAGPGEPAGPGVYDAGPGPCDGPCLDQAHARCTGAWSAPTGRRPSAPAVRGAPASATMARSRRTRTWPVLPRRGPRPRT